MSKSMTLKHVSTDLVLRSRSGPVDLVAQDEDGAVGQLLVRQQGVQLHLGLAKALAVASVDQKHDGVHRGEVVFPHLI